jgi:hypothetical protein
MAERMGSLGSILLYMLLALGIGDTCSDIYALFNFKFEPSLLFRVWTCFSVAVNIGLMASSFVYLASASGAGSIACFACANKDAFGRFFKFFRLFRGISSFSSWSAIYAAFITWLFGNCAADAQLGECGRMCLESAFSQCHQLQIRGEKN